MEELTRNEQIYSAAESLFGDTSDEMEAFCDAAADWLESRLKSGVTAESCGSTFCIAAAMLAFSMKSDAESAAGNVTSYTAGSVSVKTEGGNASRLRTVAETLMSPYCESSDFAFLGVDG